MRESDTSKTKSRAGRRPSPATGKRINIYLAADLVEWWAGTPAREKSKFISEAIREKLGKGGTYDR